MKTYHAFSNEVRVLFMYNYSCFECGRSDRGITLHHNKSQWKTNKYTESAFNCVPLCLICHEKVKQDKTETERYCLLSMKYLQREGYIPKQIDIDYLEEYKLLDLIKEL